MGERKTQSALITCKYHSSTIPILQFIDSELIALKTYSQ